MNTNADEEIRAFLGRMAASVEVDRTTPSRVRWGARGSMAVWAVLVGGAALALPALVLMVASGQPIDRAPAVGEDPRLAFTRGSSTLWTMAPDGSDQRQLSPPGMYAIQPDWSPDGERIVFVGDGDIRIIDVDGGQATTPSADTAALQPVGPEWSPDGSSIAFEGQSPPGGPPGVFLMDVGDGSVRSIVGGSGYSSISWSPDGREIAFTRPRGEREDIWAVDVVTGDRRQITDDGFGYDPAWSPDGSQIAYFHGGEIWLADADGSGGRRRVTVTKEGEAFSPHWSSDGRWITFYSPGTSDANDLFRIHPDGTGLDQLTTTPQDERGGDWRPVG